MSELLSKPVTLEDVARASGTSLATASLALNGKGRVKASTRENVRRMAEEMGFVANPMARRLASGHNNRHIDIYVLQLSAGVGLDKLRFIQAALMARGFDVPVHSYDFYGIGVDESGRKVELMRTLRRQRPRAIICATPGASDEVLRELEAYIAEGGVALCYDDAVEVECDNVIFDVAHNIYLAARHLVEMGHRKIGLYIQGQKPGGVRVEGFERALHEAGLQTRSDWIWGTSEAGERGGLKLAGQFLASRERPTGMVIINDNSALGFVAGITRAGLKVPQDVSIVGHDDLPSALCCPVPLTTVSHPAREIADLVVEFLHGRLEGDYDGPSRRITVQGELMQRESVARLQ